MDTKGAQIVLDTLRIGYDWQVVAPAKCGNLIQLVHRTGAIRLNLTITPDKGMIACILVFAKTIYIYQIIERHMSPHR
jgi:hypothetical protein